MPDPLVVVGASLAGLRAVEAARRAGFDGPLVLVGAEPHLPYDRPPLSKAWLAAGPAPEVPTYRPRADLDELGVELRLGTPASGLDVDAREVLLDGERLRYGALVVATGAAARTLPGEQPDGVHVLRTVDDARDVRAGLERGARTVVVGAGFIGSEVASAARARELPVTVVEAAPAPLVRAVGPTAAPLLTALHGRAGTDLRCGAGVAGFEQHGGRVTGVRLDDGGVLPADLVVVGVGAAPCTGWLDGSGLAVDDGVVCDGALRAAPGVFVAGDVARVRDGDRDLRVEHWTSAAEQGALAGANAVASTAGEPLRTASPVPYFWSDVYGSRVQLVGRPTDDTELLGAEDGPWLVLYRDGDRLAGALGLDLPGRIMKFRALVARGAGIDDAHELVRAAPLPVAS
ncbi:MAG TPA: FAD-dependent oxidoreductase [Mycobacteriales bacterium]|nr:FAD-dependent oxidoreductase [Mycobacteriales bacterium]